MKRFVLIGALIGALLCAQSASAAIAFDAAATGLAGASSSLTWSHTVTGSNTILIVGCRASGDSSGITGITYNGVSMTQIGTGVTLPDGTPIKAFYLLSPTTGTHNVVCSYGATAFSANGVSASYTGAKQSGQPDSSNTGTASAAVDFTVSTTVVAANSWLVLLVQNSNYGASVDAGTGSTKRAGGFGEANEDYALMDSNGTVSTGSQPLQAVRIGGSTPHWGGIILSIAEDTGGGGGGTGGSGLMLGRGVGAQ